MSRGPNKEQIAELRKELMNRRRLNEELKTAKQWADRLPTLGEEWRTCQKNIIRLLEEQDCKSDGNHGWEVRVASLLEELLRQERECV